MRCSKDFFIVFTKVDFAGIYQAHIKLIHIDNYSQ